jgi:photosystem II stability/assembly factor-like uncharacterized protein
MTDRSQGAVRSGVPALLGALLITILGSGCDDNPATPTTDVTWSRIQGMNGGNIHALTVDSDGNVFAGAADRIIYRSTDSGVVWSQSSRFSQHASVHALAASGTTVYAGTFGGAVFRWNAAEADWSETTRLSHDARTVVDLAAESDSRVLAAAQSGLYRTTDGGETWTHLTESVGGNTYNTVATDLGGSIFVGTGAGSSEGKIFLSTDAGGSWTERHAAPEPISVLRIDSTGNIFAGTQAGVVRSIDGIAWEHVGFGNSSVTALASDGGDRVYAATNGDGIFRSTDNGETWAHTSAGLPATSVLCLAIDNEDRIHAGVRGHGVFRSTDRGDTWQETSSGLSAGHVTTLKRNPGGVLFVGTSFGVHRSPDEGVTWLPARLRQRWVRSLLVDLSPTVFAGTDEEIFRSVDDGESWNSLAGGPSRATALTVTAAGSILAGSWEGVHRTTDQGVTWAVVNEGLATTRVESLAVTASGQVLAGTALGEIYRSENNGDSWTLVHDSGFADRVNAFIILSDGQIVAATSQNLYRSRDDGGRWERIGPSGNCLATNAHDHVFVGFGGGVAWATALGQGWEYIYLRVSIQALLADSAGYLLAGTRSEGLYRTDAPLL